MYRHFAPAFSALSGDGARRLGGRWNPAESFPVVYTALDVDTVDRELARSLARAGMSPAAARPRTLATIRVRLTRILDLTDPAMLQRVGVTREEILAEDPALPRAIGDAAHRLGYEAVLAPSATGSGRVLAVFLDNLAAGSTVEVEAIAEGYRPTTQEPSVQGTAET